MHFISPAFLVYGTLLGVVVALYLFRPRPRRVRVSTLPFFKAIAKVHQESEWMRRLKRLLSFLMSMGMVAAVVLALARWVIAPSTDDLASVVLVIDTGAAMAAVDDAGETRLDAAKRLLEERLAGLSSATSVAIVTYDRRAEIALAMTLDRRAVSRELAACEVRPLAADPERALTLARRIAAVQTPAAIWHVTDGVAAVVSTDAPSEPENDETALSTAPTTESTPKPAPKSDLTDTDIELVRFDVGLPDPTNAGFTAFRLRPLPLDEGSGEAFFEVSVVAPKPVEAEFRLEVDGALAGLRRLTIAPGERERWVVPIDARTGDVLTARLELAGDALATDNIVRARIPELQESQVLWIHGDTVDPFTRLALTSISEQGVLRVFEGDASQWPPKQHFDAVVFDGFVPTEWPDTGALVVIDPPASVGSLRLERIEDGLPLSAIRATDDTHPLLYGVATDRVALTQTAVLAPSALSPLWVGSAGPIVSVGELEGQRVAVLAFSPQLSERLPLMASYPLLLGNALLWSLRWDTEWSDPLNHETGAIVDAEGETIEWYDEGGDSFAMSRGSISELDRVGLWSIGDLHGSANLLAATETRLARPESDAATAVGSEGWFGSWRGDQRETLVWGLLLLLLGEFWLLHRRGVY